MRLLKNPMSFGVVLSMAVCTAAAPSLAAQVNIVRINGGGSPPAANATGAGNLATIFNAACDWWEAALVTSPYTLTLTYQWGPRSGTTLASHSLTAQGGTPNRETAGTITFDNDGSTDWFLDPTPLDPSEYTTYSEGTGGYGGGVMNNQMSWSGPTGAAVNQFDLFRTALHEVGHALGLSSLNVAFQAERGDNDVDVTAPRPFVGSAIPLNSASAHVTPTSMLMCGGCATRNLRRYPSLADMLANAQISQMDGISWVSHDGCSRYIAGTSGFSGASNTIPFGTSSPSSQVTTFASNNGLSAAGNTVYFDVDVGVGSHVYLHGVAVNTDVAAGTPIQADIYRRAGTYVGATGSAAGWTLWTTAKGTSAGTGSESRLDFNSGVYLASSSTNGIASVARDYDTNYTNGANSYSNADLTITAGAATTAPFGSATPFTPRTANVRLYYQRDSADWHNQKYQTILRAQELGGPGVITGLAFNASATGVHYNRLLRIRMTHKPSGYALLSTFSTNIAGYTTVLNELDHTWEVQGSSWSEIGLQSGFVYDGTSDVVVEILARGNHTSRGTVAGFRRDADSNTPRAFRYGWSWSSEPTSTSAGGAGGGIDMNGAKIRAEFACANAGEFGTSCSYAFADAVGTPVAGLSSEFHIHDGPANRPALLMLGFTVPGVPLSGAGFDGCYSWVDNVFSVAQLTDPSGFAAHALSIPNTTAFDGTKVYGQWLALDPAAPRGLAFTNYVRLVVGQSNP